jgi:prolipoprotein diacylglyceryltransferase
VALTSWLESALVEARRVPWPGAWVLTQLLAAAVTSAWMMRATRCDRKLVSCWFLALPCAAVGACALGFAYRFPAWISGRSDDLVGAAAFGALAGAALGFAWLARRKGVPPLEALDRVAPALMLLLATGRVGCFLAGCDAGVPSRVDWAVRFPAGTEAFREHAARGLVLASDRWSLAVHPAQLYEALAALVIFVASARALSTSASRAGGVFLSTVASYAIARAAIDAVRSIDSRLTDGQLTALLVVVIAAIVVANGRKKAYAALVMRFLRSQFASTRSPASSGSSAGSRVPLPEAPHR